ncbi:MAG: beta,4-N-acetylglucosaminyltransferase [Euryarchaeota archaeon]|nr:beta,4-N-acetylglucosaminyltransferase [Euryarchaeota archaeon]
MIFVTVGMHNQGFERLIEKCDILAGQIEDKMIMQKGSTSYCPRNAEYFDFASNEEFLKLIRQSSTVITHDGAGSILNCLLNKKRTIVVPRLKEYNECRYDNKLDLALELHKMKKIHLVTDLALLTPELIRDAKAANSDQFENTLLINIKKYITK